MMASKRKRRRRYKAGQQQPAYDPTPEEIEERTAEFRERHRQLLLRGEKPDPMRMAGREVSTEHLPPAIRRRITDV